MPNAHAATHKLTIAVPVKVAKPLNKVETIKGVTAIVREHFPESLTLGFNLNREVVKGEECVVFKAVTSADEGKVISMAAAIENFMVAN